MAVAVAVRYEDDSADPVAAMTAVWITASDVDNVDEATNDPITYYLSAECSGEDTAKSEVFAGDFTWQGWIAPAAGDWTFHLRKVEDDSSVADSGAVTFS